MGIQAHFSFNEAVTKISRIDGSTEIQTEVECYPADEGYSKELISLYHIFHTKHAVIKASGSVGSDSLWFDANSWGEGRKQIDTLKHYGIEFIES